MLVRRALATSAVFAAVCASIACSGEAAPDDEGQAGASTGGSGGGTAVDEPYEREPVGDCAAIEAHFTEPSATHVPECSDIEYPMSPPVFGDHYPTWPAYQTYDWPIPLGYLVHGLEHGAVVYLYDCPDGCDDEVAAAQAMIDAFPADPRCADAVKHQVILAPGSGFGARWAAAAWGYSLRADCFDLQYFGQFYEDHHGHGPEDLCNQGLPVPEGACPELL